jgi:hypothetical protein
MMDAVGEAVDGAIPFTQAPVILSAMGFVVRDLLPGAPDAALE